MKETVWVVDVGFVSKPRSVQYVCKYRTTARVVKRNVRRDMKFVPEMEWVEVKELPLRGGLYDPI